MIKKHFRVFITVFAVWLVYALLIYYSKGTLADKGVFGDSFGALSSLFSGLAFAALIVTIFQQSEEIAKLSREQENSRQLLDEQVKVLRATAKLNYLNDVIARQRKLIDDSPVYSSHEEAIWLQNANDRLDKRIKERVAIYEELNK